MTTTEPRTPAGVEWIEGLCPPELRKEADEILEALSRVERDLEGVMARAYQLGQTVEEVVSSAQETVTSHQCRNEADVDSDVTSGIEALVHALSGADAVYGTLMRLAEVPVPAAVLGGVEVDR